MYMQFKFEIVGKIQRNKTNKGNKVKKLKIVPNFEMRFNYSSKALEKNGAKKTKRINLPSANLGTRQRSLCRTPCDLPLGKELKKIKKPLPKA